jgi:hypothetical protein
LVRVGLKGAQISACCEVDVSLKAPSRHLRERAFPFWKNLRKALKIGYIPPPVLNVTRLCKL